MCGFAGQINLQGLAGRPEQRLTWLRAMGQQLARHGPDDEQFYDDGVLALVFRRLSIIDLAGGRQPIWNEDHSIFAAVNGEIYNHQDIRRRLSTRHVFSTSSDSEVIVHLFEEHGASVMEELNGMFAFIVWDTSNRRLLMARDRLGIKPLFFTVVGNSLIFASKLKALLAHPDCPRDLDWQDFMQSSALKHHLPTSIKEVRQLPGGHYLCVEQGKPIEPCAYWSLRDHISPAKTAAGRTPNPTAHSMANCSTKACISV
jgi:asparagine synthase (glutamine-hydrolysing)